jgi:hypothetical protein
MYVLSYTNISLAQKVEALSLKLNNLQREMAGLRQDVRAILHLLSEVKQVLPATDIQPDDHEASDVGET